ncbi:MAG: hypothetical protein VKJ64_17840 [Leptolyngbyaceae bacterium]|nr:hypothetical protein [Leptolyngbyaceae bacterium]
MVPNSSSAIGEPKAFLNQLLGFNLGVSEIVTLGDRPYFLTYRVYRLTIELHTWPDPWRKNLCAQLDQLLLYPPY